MYVTALILHTYVCMYMCELVNTKLRCVDRVHEVYMDTHLNQVNGGANKVVQLYIADSEC